MLPMRSFNDFHYPEPPVTPGNYLLGLGAIRTWYNRRVETKGKLPHENNLDEILPIIIDRVFGNVNESEEKIDLLLNLDCIIKDESEYVKKKIEEMVLAQVVSMFPKIAANIPTDHYFILEKDLIISVPQTYEDQRGYFF